jgi:hypothetical protein
MVEAGRMSSHGSRKRSIPSGPVAFHPDTFRAGTTVSLISAAYGDVAEPSSIVFLSMAATSSQSVGSSSGCHFWSMGRTSGATIAPAAFATRCILYSSGNLSFSQVNSQIKELLP